MATRCPQAALGLVLLAILAPALSQETGGEAQASQPLGSRPPPQCADPMLPAAGRACAEDKAAAGADDKAVADAEDKGAYSHGYAIKVANCGNLIQDGFETWIDCGGPQCKPCGAGLVRTLRPPPASAAVWPPEPNGCRLACRVRAGLQAQLRLH